MFPDVKPKKLGRRGTVTIINKDGSSYSYNIQNQRQVMARVLINEPLDSDFTLDKIRYADAYNKVQYWNILSFYIYIYHILKNSGSEVMDHNAPYQSDGRNP